MRKIKVYYREKIVGDFSADIIVYEDEELILELKAVQKEVQTAGPGIWPRAADSPKLTSILILLILQIL